MKVKVKKKTSKEELYKMELHDRMIAYIDIDVFRVPGGWIYDFGRAPVFVPFNNEFQNKEEVKNGNI